MEAKINPRWYEPAVMKTIVVHPPAETKRPIGFAPWLEEKPKRKRAPRKTSEEV